MRKKPAGVYVLGLSAIAKTFKWKLNEIPQRGLLILW